MKCVKNRPVYDIETAEEIACYAPITDSRDIDLLSETLYKTQNDEYFLHCEGGANTQYAKRVSNGQTGGEELRRLTRDEALD